MYLIDSPAVAKKAKKRVKLLSGDGIYSNEVCSIIQGKFINTDSLLLCIRLRAWQVELTVLEDEDDKFKHPVDKIVAFLHDLTDKPRCPNHFAYDLLWKLLEYHGWSERFAFFQHVRALGYEQGVQEGYRQGEEVQADIIVRAIGPIT